MKKFCIYIQTNDVFKFSFSDSFSGSPRKIDNKKSPGQKTRDQSRMSKYNQTKAASCAVTGNPEAGIEHGEKSDITKYQCDQCSFTCGRISGMNNHRRRTHNRDLITDKGKDCEIKQPVERNKGMPYSECIKCDILLEDKDQTNFHYINVHNNIWENIIHSICQHCGKRFESGRQSVEKHIKEQHLNIN